MIPVALESPPSCHNEQSGHQRTEASEHPPRAVAERHRGRAYVGWKQFRHVDCVAGEDTDYEEAVDQQQDRVRSVCADSEEQVQADDQRPQAMFSTSMKAISLCAEVREVGRTRVRGIGPTSGKSDAGTLSPDFRTQNLPGS
jgi:hypothetical protein